MHQRREFDDPAQRARRLGVAAPERLGHAGQIFEHQPDRGRVVVAPQRQGVAGDDDEPLVVPGEVAGLGGADQRPDRHRAVAFEQGGGDREELVAGEAGLAAA